MRQFGSDHSFFQGELYTIRGIRDNAMYHRTYVAARDEFVFAVRVENGIR